MARWQYDNVVIDEQGNALDNIQITVYEEDGVTEAVIYNQREGGTTKGNPFLTDETGLIQFFIEPGTYKVFWEETEIPIRVSDREVWIEAIVGEDFQAITDVQNTIWTQGDFKESAQETDHGRWLLCDGRSLTETEIEDALDLETGEAADFVALMNVGTNSKYGSTTASEVLLPDFRDKFAINKGTTHPYKGAGSSGGAEEVTLTALESGLRAHDHPHNITIDPNGGHIHGFLVDNPDFYAITGFELVTINYAAGGSSTSQVMRNPTETFVTGIAGNTDAESDHIHGTTGGVQDRDAVNATEGHDNMPPYRVKGNTFIRV
jgi:hypothetical protein